MQQVAIFPLNTVMFPGVTAPLHIFEDRYRALMRDLLATTDPAERVFGIVAIREGYEVGDVGVQSSHRVGTLVQLVSHQAYEDGRYDIEVVGRQRLRVIEVHSGEYLTADVEVFEEPAGAAAAADHEQAARALAAFDDYRTRLSKLRGGPVLAGELPTDPTYLSYALAATCLLTLGQRQDLLEVPDTGTRLRRLRQLLHTEQRAMSAVPSLPATEIARNRWCPN